MEVTNQFHLLTVSISLCIRIVIVITYLNLLVRIAENNVKAERTSGHKLKVLDTRTNFLTLRQTVECLFEKSLRVFFGVIIRKIIALF